MLTYALKVLGNAINHPDPVNGVTIMDFSTKTWVTHASFKDSSNEFIPYGNKLCYFKLGSKLHQQKVKESTSRLTLINGDCLHLLRTAFEGI